MPRRALLVVLAMSSIAGECSPASNPFMYSTDLVSLAPQLGRMCDDPAGAPIAVEATYLITCTDEDQCGGDLGEEHTVTYLIDAASGGEVPLEDVVLDNGDVIPLDDSCMQFTGELQAYDPLEDAFTGVGWLNPDCTIGVDGAAAMGRSQYRLSLDHVAVERVETTCEDDSAYAGPVLSTLEARGSDFCADGATLDLGGVGEAVCMGASTCTANDTVTFAYGLEAFGEYGAWPEVSLSDGGNLHLPFHCVDALVAIVGDDDGTDRSVATTLDGCVLSYDEAEVSDLTDLRLEGHILGLPDTAFSQACP